MSQDICCNYFQFYCKIHVSLLLLHWTISPILFLKKRWPRYINIFIIYSPRPYSQSKTVYANSYCIIRIKCRIREYKRSRDTTVFFVLWSTTTFSLLLLSSIPNVDIHKLTIVSRERLYFHWVTAIHHPRPTARFFYLSFTSSFPSLFVSTSLYTLTKLHGTMLCVYRLHTDYTPLSLSLLTLHYRHMSSYRSLSVSDTKSHVR